MDRKEMETKLIKHGLPTWGTDEQVKARLERNEIIPATKVRIKPTLVADEEKAEVLEGIIAQGLQDFDAEAKPMVVSGDEPLKATPRKMGRPKKVK